MRPRSQRLRSSRKVQFSAKRKAKKRQKEITGFYRVLRNLQNDEGAECRRNACIPIAEANQSCTKCNDKQSRNRSQKTDYRTKLGILPIKKDPLAGVFLKAEASLT